MLRIVVCVSGGGTNLQAILDAMESGRITNTEVLAVISNNAGAGALERAKAHGIQGIGFRQRLTFIIWKWILDCLPISIALMTLIMSGCM